MEKAFVLLRGLPQAIYDAGGSQTPIARLHLPVDGDRPSSCFDPVTQDGPDLGDVTNSFYVQTPRRGKSRSRLTVEPQKDAGHCRRVGGAGQVVHCRVVWIKPVGVLRLREQARIPDPIDWIARALAGVPVDAVAELLPGSGIECAPGDHAELALDLASADRDLEESPVVRRIQPR